MYAIGQHRLNDADMIELVQNWHANVIRVPIMPDLWQLYPLYFENILDPIVDLGNRYGVYILVDWHAAGNPITGETVYPAWSNSYPNDGNPFNPNITLATRFWSSVAERYKNDPWVIYDIFNEPFRITWTDWRPVAQQLVDVVQSHNSRALVLVPGVSWAYDLSHVKQDPVQRQNIVYDTHPYPGGTVWFGPWDSYFGYLTNYYPVFASEWGFEPGASDQNLDGTVQSYGQPIVAYMAQKSMSWTAFCWSTVWDPFMLQTRYTPTEFGELVKDTLSPLDNPTITSSSTTQTSLVTTPTTTTSISATQTSSSATMSFPIVTTTLSSTTQSSTSTIITSSSTPPTSTTVTTSSSTTQSSQKTATTTSATATSTSTSISTSIATTTASSTSQALTTTSNPITATTTSSTPSTSTTTSSPSASQTSTSTNSPPVSSTTSSTQVSSTIQTTTYTSIQTTAQSSSSTTAGAQTVFVTVTVTPQTVIQTVTPQTVTQTVTPQTVIQTVTQPQVIVSVTVTVSHSGTSSRVTTSLSSSSTTKTTLSSTSTTTPRKGGCRETCEPVPALDAFNVLTLLLLVAPFAPRLAYAAAGRKFPPFF